MNPARNRWPQGFGMVLLSAGTVAFASFVALLFLGLLKCGGDGGVPSSATSSPAGQFCEEPLAGPWAPALLLGPAIVVMSIGAFEMVRQRWLWLAPAGGVATLLVLFVAVFALDQSCSDADQRAYDEWVESGRDSQQPADCESY